MKKFGKKRVPECRCEVAFTCGPCLVAGILIAPAVHTPPVKRGES